MLSRQRRAYTHSCHATLGRLLLVNDQMDMLCSFLTTLKYTFSADQLILYRNGLTQERTNLSAVNQRAGYFTMTINKQS